MKTYEELINETTQILDKKMGPASNSNIGLKPGMTYKVINTYKDSFINFVKIYEIVLNRLELDKNDYLVAFENICKLATISNYSNINRLTSVFTRINKHYQDIKKPGKMKGIVVNFLIDINVEIPEDKLQSNINHQINVYFDKYTTTWYDSCHYAKHPNLTPLS